MKKEKCRVCFGEVGLGVCFYCKPSILEELPVMPESIKGNTCQSCGACDWSSANVNQDWSIKECNKCTDKPPVGPQVSPDGPQKKERE